MQLRKSNLAKLRQHHFDVLIVGGGINGAVSAAALAGKGAQVALIDRGDFAGLTSMNSSNLAWGGIKYMETADFALVRKLCMSRNHLMRSYPSTVQEIRFFTTLTQGIPLSALVPAHGGVAVLADRQWVHSNAAVSFAGAHRQGGTDRRHRQCRRRLRVLRCLSTRQ